MNTQDLAAIYQQYLDLVAAGDTDKAGALLKESVRTMTPEMRNKLIVELATLTMEDQARARDELTTMQERTIETYEKLEHMQKELQDEKANGQG